MSHEIKTETKEILDIISLEIQNLKIFPKDLSYIIAEYAISFYRVVPCPGKEESYKNLVYLSGADYNQELKHIKVGKYIYNVARDLRLYPREIGLNLLQRQNSGLKPYDVIPINLCYYDIPEILEMYLLFNGVGSYDIKVEYTKILSIDKFFTKYLTDNFRGQIFGVGQHFNIMFNGKPFDVEVTKIVQNKKHRYSISDDFHGVLTENIQRIGVTYKK